MAHRRRALCGAVLVGIVVALLISTSSLSTTRRPTPRDLSHEESQNGSTIARAEPPQHFATFTDVTSIVFRPLLPQSDAAPHCRTVKRVASLLYAPATSRDRGVVAAVYPPFDDALLRRANLTLPTLDRALQSFAWPSQTQPRPTVEAQNDASPLAYVACRYRSVVLGYAAGYDAKLLRAFVSSFQQYHSPCEVLVVFADTVDVDVVVDRAKANVAFENRFQWEARLPSAMNYTNKTRREVVRVSVLAAWLREYGSDYRYVVASDTRDVIFFANVFTAVFKSSREGGEGIFTVAEAHAFKHQSLNQFWVSEFTGSASAAAFISSLGLDERPFPVLCSGVIGGTLTAFVDYLALFELALTHAAGERSSVLATPGIDQGVHNWLLTLGLPLSRFPHSAWVFDGDFGPATHWFPEGRRLHIDVANRVLNCALEPYALVHQFDRYWQLWINLMRPHDMWPDGRREQAACAAPSLLPLPSDVLPPTTLGSVLRRPVCAVCDNLRLLDEGKIIYVSDDGGGSPSVRCLQRNALVVRFTHPDAGLLDMLVRSFHRYHVAPCDELVVILANTSMAPVLRSEPLSTALDVKVRILAVASAVRGDDSLPPLVYWLKHFAARYEFVVVVTDFNSADAAVHSNLFQPLHEEADRYASARQSPHSSTLRQRAPAPAMVVPNVPFNEEDRDRAALQVLSEIMANPTCFSGLGTADTAALSTTAAFHPLVVAGRSAAVLNLLAKVLAARPPEGAHGNRSHFCAVWDAYVTVPLLVAQTQGKEEVAFANVSTGSMRRMWLDRFTASAGPTDAHRRPMKCEMREGSAENGAALFSLHPVSLVVGVRRHVRGGLGASMWAFWRRAYPRRLPRNISKGFSAVPMNGTLLDE